jgi:hypothetical protein
LLPVRNRDQFDTNYLKLHVDRDGAGRRPPVIETIGPFFPDSTIQGMRASSRRAFLIVSGSIFGIRRILRWPIGWCADMRRSVKMKVH